MIKKVITIICIGILLMSIIGCSQKASNQKSEEELKAEIRAEIEEQALKEGQQGNDQNIESNNTGANDGRTQVDIINIKDFKIIVEMDNTKEVVRGVPVYYLSIISNDGQKKLLAQSIDRGNDWTNSIATIERVRLSTDRKKVYYSTDNTFTRSSGVGANNYRTRVVDLNTNKDSYFEEGGLITVLGNQEAPYQDHVILELNSRDSAGPTLVYQVVTPRGDQLVILDTYTKNWKTAIDQKLASEQSGSNLQEFYAVNKEYTLYNLNKRGDHDKFKLYRPNSNELYFMVNGDKFKVESMPNWSDGTLLPNKISNRYKIVPFYEEPGSFVVVIEQEYREYHYNFVCFFMYAVGYGMEPLGYYSGILGLDQMNITDIDYSSVTINDKKNPLVNN